MRAISLLCGFIALTWTSFAESPQTVVFENPHLRYTIGSNALNLVFLDRATGTDYLRKATPSPCALVRIQGKLQNATSASLTNDRLTLRFGDSGITTVLRTEVRPSCIVFTVASVMGGDVESLTFLNVPLTLKGSPSEPFGACALALNLVTRVDALPALQTELRASCEKKFGIVGAKAALVTAPMDRMLQSLQATLTSASELPVCKVAGPWAKDIPFNHGSYLFNFGSLTEANVQDWIDMVHSVGFTQIDNHGGGSFFRFGDMELNRQKWPDGWETWRRIVARLHDAGIGSIFHTYAFFIDKGSKYVTPVPDPRLDAFRTFTLAEPLSADATEIIVNESTAEMKTITGFFEQNSVVLHIGDELLTFGGVSKEAPWKFTGAKRGALGTKAAAHDRGAKARHLKEMFGLFVPNVETTLFEEIAANHADVVNRCGFDGVYLDAIDGSSILRGGDECWFWANKFVVEIQKRLKKPIGMEMSAMWHHFWQYRTRWQAWDYPQRGHRRFIDLHAQEINGGLLLPLHLGWWGFQSWNPPQIEPTYPDVMENLGARLIGWDAGISLTAGVDREALRKTPLFQRAVEILRTCEDLRHTGAFDEATKAKLREPGKEFTLSTNAGGIACFRRVQSQTQTVTEEDSGTLSWRVTNSFAAQPAHFRIETLMSAALPNDTNRIELLKISRKELASCKLTSAPGVKLEFRPMTEDEDSPLWLVATNAGTVPQNAAWVRIKKRFDPLLNLKNHEALRLLIQTPMGGGLVAVRLESPQHIAYGAVADRYVDVQSNSCRIYPLVETESSRWNDFVWNDGKGAYNVYRETINFGVVDSVSLWLQNLPAGRETKFQIGTVYAVPLRPVVVNNPKFEVAGKTIEFPIELAPGNWIECNGPDDCTVYGSKGETLKKVVPRGEWPVLGAGVTPLKFSCETVEGANPRARITVFSQGEEL